MNAQMTVQTPLGSGFGASSTASEVIRGCDLSGKVAVVTGGYGALGLETARTLASAGARVIIAGRQLEAAQSAAAGIAGARGEALDLLDAASIDDFATRLASAEPALHILVNNAAIMANPLTRDGRGYESQFATNHLGHFQLTARLWPLLSAAQGARIVAVSSRGHHIAPADLDDPSFERGAYDRWVAYGRSKTANVLFAVQADLLGRDAGVRAFALHPGGIMTGLAKHMSQEDLRANGAIDADGEAILDPARDMKTVAQGAATSVWCAASPSLQGRGGVYCEDCDIAIVTPAGATDARGVNPWAVDIRTAKRLWVLSAAMTGVGLPL